MRKPASAFVALFSVPAPTTQNRLIIPRSIRRFCGALIFASVLASILPLVPQLSGDTSVARPGYYRSPAIHGETIIFTAEGDLWAVNVKGGVAKRLTSNPGEEIGAAISPDGKAVAFTAEYDGPRDVYTMSVDGGLPERRTWDGNAEVAGWTPDGRLLINTDRYSTRPFSKLVAIGPNGAQTIVPLAQAAEASYSSDGRTLFFTRFRRQSSSTKRYRGGTAENIWRYDGAAEAVPLTADWSGTSHNPMFWDGRLYFLSDRDGVMNVYSINSDGHDLKQHTHHRDFDVQSASISDGRIVYQWGADLRVLDLRSGNDEIVPITLLSDFDQLREHWVKKPLDYLTEVHISPDGGSAVFTARGEVFSMPAKSGRIVEVAGAPGVRYRDARFLPDGKTILALSTETGETEFWKFPANGSGSPEQWTHDGKVLRWEGVPSPDGRWMANRDKDQQLWLFDVRTKEQKRIAQSMESDFADLVWSPDSQWLAFVEDASNHFAQIKVLNVNSGAIETLTSDRYNSGSPAWSSDGKWLYFLSDRMLTTAVHSPWGARQPEPYFDRSMKVYQLALVNDLRSPFSPADELHPDPTSKPTEPKETKSDKDEKPVEKSADKKEEPKKEEPKKAAPVNIDFKNLASRLSEVPAPPGNYSDLVALEKRLCWTQRDEDLPPKMNLQCVDIANQRDPVETVMPDIKSFEPSMNRKKLLVNKGDDFFILDSDAKGAALADGKTLAKVKIDLSHWTFTTTPRADYRGLFLDSWRLERDYFYDRHMHGVDWVQVRQRYLPLVDRVADRAELNDLIAQMVSELSALHIFVHGGDSRKAPDDVELASLGATLRRDKQTGGAVVEHIFIHDPDLPNEAAPLERPESMVHEGEVIVSIDGESLLNVPDERAVLRGKAGRQVMLQVKSASGEMREVIVTPISLRDEQRLRYKEWEYSRRLKVESDSKGQIGYVHLQAMGPADIEQWAREFYPVYDRQGLIVDVRDNHGGNIDSWILEKLMRQSWFFFQPRIGNPTWNMQYAFRGHIVVLCDQNTASDGEAFAEGFRRLGLGKVIGTRTWGGEVWLSANNRLADSGIATAAETGVYGPEGKWLIEGHGVDPDIEVDDLPHATFAGDDAQLDAAVQYLQKQIQDDPRPVPKAPPYPDKAFKDAH